MTSANNNVMLTYKVEFSVANKKAIFQIINSAEHTEDHS